MKRVPERSTGGMLGSAETTPPRIALRTDRSGLTSRSDRRSRFTVERSGGPRAIAQALPIMEPEAAAKHLILATIAPDASRIHLSRTRRCIRR